MKAYIIIENNGCEYDDYKEWIYEVYLDKNNAIKKFDELVVNSKWRPPKLKKEIQEEQKRFYQYYDNGNNGFYRFEEHEIINYFTKFS